jgi:hypothetical protein
MMDKRLKSEIAQRELSDLGRGNHAADPSHFDSRTTRMIKSGSKCRVRCLGESYNLRRGWVSSPRWDGPTTVFETAPFNHPHLSGQRDYSEVAVQLRIPLAGLEFPESSVL